MQGPRILVVRLGAMGDVIHTLPAVASLKHSLPYSRITWIVESKWQALLEGNPYVEQVIPLDRRTPGGLLGTGRELRAVRFDFAVDFQGLTKSAIVATLARAERIFGFGDSREAPASWFYSTRIRPRGVHMVERNLELAEAAGATNLLRTFPIPNGSPEGTLPKSDFVLACPSAGWGGKEWPLEFYSALGARLRRETGLTLVLNGPQPPVVENTHSHVSGLAGLIDATRRAVAVVGLDSGPLHLAAALGKPGVAIYGPTDPSINGPYASAITLLRSPDAATTYKRLREPHASMRAVGPEAVFEALKPVLLTQPAAKRS
jgi:heptosyltransferase-1